MGNKRRGAVGVAMLALVLSVTVVLLTAAPANALIHEKIAALCRAGGEEVEPPGQSGQSQGQSFVRALQATGIISSIVETSGLVTVNFDLSKPSSKYTSAGFNLLIEDGIAPGVDLLLAPLPVPDMTFPAHSRCHQLNP